MDNLVHNPGSEVYQERLRAHQKHAAKGSMETVPWDHEKWLPVLTEELGEAAKELCEYYLENQTFEQTADLLRAELVQLAAMTTAWIAAIDSYREEYAIQERATKEVPLGEEAQDS